MKESVFLEYWFLISMNCFLACCVCCRCICSSLSVALAFLELTVVYRRAFLPICLAHIYPSCYILLYTLALQSPLI